MVAIASMLGFVSLNTLASEDRNGYLSDVDKFLTIHKVTVLPATDNVNDLYARPVETKLKELVGQAHRFELIEIKNAEGSLTTSDYETDTTKIKNLNANADALISAHITKNPQSVELTLDLFMKSDGLLLAQEIKKLDNSFQTNQIVQAAQEMYSQLIKKVPYEGLILSRQGNRVTVDVGSRDGISNNTVITVEQIISINRHPKFHFILGAERVTLGKVKLVKVDETLSFGVIIAEKERGVISVDHKVSGLGFLNYAKSPDNLDSGESADSGAVKFSKTKSDILPSEQPSFGKVGLGLGLGSFNTALSFQNEGSYGADSSLYPQLQLTGEIWITKSWYTGTEIRQGTTSSLNSTAGGITGGVRTAYYDLYAGYKFLLQDDFWGPQINLHLGFASSTMVVDRASITSLSSTAYSGLYYGIGGSIPISRNRSTYIDIMLNRFFLPQFSETPVASGAASSSSAMLISLGGSYRFTPHISAVAHLEYEFYSTTFTGPGARNSDIGLNSSQSLTSLISGVNYTF